MSDTTIAALIGGAIGSGITGVFALITIWMQRRSEERRQIRELAVKAAIENWSRDFELAKMKNGSVLLQPLDVYLVHAMHLVSALDGSIKTPENIRAHLRQTLAMTNAAQKEIDEYNKTKRAAS